MGQQGVHRALVELSARFKVSDTSRFRYFLWHARPRAKTNERLWRILERYPDLYDYILLYFQRYSRLPRAAGDRLVAGLKRHQLYGAVIAELLWTAEGRLEPRQMLEVDAYVKSHWRPREYRSADLLAALGRWGVKRGVLSPGKVEVAVRSLPEWWTRAELVVALDSRAIPQPALNELLLDKLNDEVSDVAIAAAVFLAQQGSLVPQDQAYHTVVGPVLGEFGLLPGDATRVCAIARSFERLLGRKLPAVNWQHILGRTYRRVERQAVYCYAYAAADVTSWVSAMDVFNDALLVGLCRADSTIGTYKKGAVGSFVESPTSRFAVKYPALWRMMKSIHDKRGDSVLSHAWKKKGRSFVKPTSYIKYAYLRTGKRLIADAIRELSAKWPL